MAEHYRCGHLYGGAIEDAKAGQTIVVEDGTIAFAGATDAAPSPADGDEIVDYSGYFVLPGLVDLHTHLTYGNAMCEEDIDFYGSSEFRALRGVVAAQRLLAAGYTSMADPGGSNFVAVSIRDAVDAGIVVGPRINCSSQYITSHQGLTDYFPEYSVGNVTTGIGKVVMDGDSAIETIRVQVKDGVDFVKFAMDGRHVDRDGALLAAFTLDETRRMVDECHRLGKKTAMHARGREATLFSALAGADLIFPRLMGRCGVHRCDARQWLRRLSDPAGALPQPDLHPARPTRCTTRCGPTSARANGRRRWISCRAPIAPACRS